LLLLNIQDGTRADAADKQHDLRHITACTFTPDGSRLLAASAAGKIAIFEVSKERKLKTAGQFVGHSRQVECVAASNDSRFAISGGHEQKLCLWQIDNAQELGAFTGFRGPIRACMFAPNGRTAWATDGAVLTEIDVKKRAVVKQTSLASSAAGKFAAISPDGAFVAAGDSFGTRLWQAQSGRELPKLEEREFQFCATFTPDGTRLVTGGAGKIEVWDVAAQRKIVELETASHFIAFVVASRDNQHVAASAGLGSQGIQVFRIPRD
jgi:WD40 repeat protein